MHPLPSQPPPEGWVYIQHPVIGCAENPVSRDSLHTWVRNGWSEVTEYAPPVPPSAPTAEQASPAPAKE